MAAGLPYLEALLRRELAASDGDTSIEKLRHVLFTRRPSGHVAWSPPPPPPPLRRRHGSRPRCSPCSIALGAVELALTAKDATKRAWPADLPSHVEALAASFDGFVEELAAAAPLAAAPSAAAKVKAVADAVWSRLTKGSFSKDLPHAQVLPGLPCPVVLAWPCECGWHTARQAFPDTRMPSRPRTSAARLLLCRCAAAQRRPAGREAAARLRRRGHHDIRAVPGAEPTARRARGPGSGPHASQRGPLLVAAGWRGAAGDLCGSDHGHGSQARPAGGGRRLAGLALHRRPRRAVLAAPGAGGAGHLHQPRHQRGQEGGEL